MTYTVRALIVQHMRDSFLALLRIHVAVLALLVPELTHFQSSLATKKHSMLLYISVPFTDAPDIWLKICNILHVLAPFWTLLSAI